MVLEREGEERREFPLVGDLYLGGLLPSANTEYAMYYYFLSHLMKYTLYSQI